MKLMLPLCLFSFLVLESCNSKNPDADNIKQSPIHFVELPDDLTKIPSESFEPFLAMIGNSPLIGITEGTHGMNEPLDFRNELIKFLVTEKRIDVVAIESGILESRIVHDYINGSNGDIDTVVKYGLMPGFNELPQNKTLIEWLRNYNENDSNVHKVKFYGFDIPGIPTNPWNEDIAIPLSETLNYLKKVDNENWKLYSNKLSFYFEFLHINPTPDDTSKEYRDLSEVKKKELTSMIDELIKLFKSNKSAYIQNSSNEDFDWGHRAVKSSKWMDDFLLAMGGEPDYSYNNREQAMFDNLEWIMNREKGKNVLLFAHLAHLTKDFSLLDENSKDTRPKKLFGEYIGEKFGDEYLVVGNFFSELYYPKDTVSVSQEGLEPKFVRDNIQNYYMKLDKSDSTFNRGWKYGLRPDETNWYMNPAIGIDIIFYTKTQTYID
ncbi:MAG: erythromycin esterase family protein [Fluviicola sp.]